uniref:Uncharacterized protein n=1 Tax=Pelusios castaneus TaxID=367368 RepID=A0A8C8VGW0_9SAUR
FTAAFDSITNGPFQPGVTRPMLLQLQLGKCVGGTGRVGEQEPERNGDGGPESWGLAGVRGGAGMVRDPAGNGSVRELSRNLKRKCFKFYVMCKQKRQSISFHCCFHLLSTDLCNSEVSDHHPNKRYKNTC